MNDSTTSGYLLPSDEPAPLEGTGLSRFLQAFVVGVTGMNPTTVRPRWQTTPGSEVPNIPKEFDVWCGIGVVSRQGDTYAMNVHNDDGDTVQRHETLDIQCSFYDTGQSGDADKFAAILREGLSVAQNLESLFLAGFGLVDVGELLAVPSLIKMRWLYRVDLPLRMRRQIDRLYPVKDIVSSDSVLVTDVPPFTRNINVDHP